VFGFVGYDKLRHTILYSFRVDIGDMEFGLLATSRA